MAEIRAAKLTAVQSFDDTWNPFIAYSNPSGNSVDALDACISLTGALDDIKYRAINKTKSTYRFELTEDERNVLRKATQDSNSRTVRFYVRTTIKGVYYFSWISTTFKIINANPVVTADVVADDETYALTGNYKKLIKYYSNATATMDVKAQKYASINEDLYIIRNGDNTGYGTSHTFKKVESNEFLFQSEDSRGNVGTATKTLEMVDYIPLTCNIVNSKPDALGNMQVYCYGNYFNGSFGKVANTLNVEYRYAEVGGSYSEWIAMTPTLYDESYTAYANFVIADFNQKKSYIFEVKAKDELETVSKETLPIKSVPIFHWGEEDFVFEVPVEFKGGVIGLPIDDLPEISNGIWTPYLLGDAISLYTTQKGTYSKVGQVVTVGFYIKATCKSGYQTTVIEINGLPFVPSRPTAGGGMASRTFVPGGMTFQCFVAETTGKITTRVQGCGHEDAGNLATSADGCCYRSGGGEIILSGTITYISNS